MSFDTTFDFAMTVNILQKQLTAFQSQLSSIDQEAAQFSQCCGYAHITGPQLKSLEQRKQSIVPRVEEAEKALTSIQELQSLGQHEKDMLYTLYVLSKDNVSNFMTRIVGNHGEILTDKDVQMLLTDGSNSQETKALLSQHILGKYQSTMMVPIMCGRGVGDLIHKKVAI